MAKSKRPGKSKGIVTTHRRNAEALASAQLQRVEDQIRFAEKRVDDLTDEKNQIVDGIDTEPVEGKVVMFSDKEEYFERIERQAREVEEGVLLLPGKVMTLFEQTRDGKKTPEGQRLEILQDPEITGEDVFNAVKLGIRAWGPSFFGERKV